jgi:hypothetical protein
MAEKKTIATTKTVTEIDSKERLKAVVKNLYQSGSDNRQQKNGAHEKLYSTILESGHSITTCGVDAILPRYLQQFLDTKKFPDEVDYKGKTTFEGIREIAIIIDKLYKMKSNDVYISMTSVGASYLRQIISGEELRADEYRKHFNLWGKYGVITQQEKSKNRPGKQRTK